MRKIFSWLSLALVLGGSSLASGAELTHRPKFEEGKELRTQTEIKTNQTLTLAGMPLETKAEQFMITVDKVLSAPSSGGAEVAGKFETMQMNLSLPGGQEFSFDSGNPDAPAIEPLATVAEFLKTLSGAESVTTYGPDGRATSVTWKGDPFASIDESLKAETDPKVVIKTTNQEIDRLPGKDVSVGDKWTRSEEFPLGAGQVLHTEVEYSYLGPANVAGKTIERIGIKSTGVKLMMEPNAANPLTLKASDLSVKDSTGEIHFDPSQGRVVMTQNKLQITGSMTLVFQGMELPGDLDLTIETKNTLQ